MNENPNLKHGKNISITITEKNVLHVKFSISWFNICGVGVRCIEPSINAFHEDV